MSADYVTPTDEPQPPNAKIFNQEDGSVRVSVGEYVGFVSSHHLVLPKVNQLNNYWRKMHAREKKTG